MSAVAAVFLITGLIPGGIRDNIFNIVFAALSGVLYLIAAGDASKYLGAWLVSLIDVVLNVAALALVAAGVGSGLITGVVKMQDFWAALIALALNIIAFIAANNVKKQAKKGKAGRIPMAY